MKALDVRYFRTNLRESGMIAYWVVAGFFTAFGWHYGEKFIVTYIDTPPAIEKKVDKNDK
jgi:hypothetical protein